MPAYSAPISDMRFLLDRVFDFDQVTADLGYEDIDTALAMEILEEGGKLCSELLAPLNESGDAQGSRIVDGAVRTPNGFPSAYRTYVEAGWPSLSSDPALGGQGLPKAVGVLFGEMLCAANMSFSLFSGLTHSAVDAIASHADETLKALYLPKMISGEWTGAMALTEAHAGTDLGLLRTRAVPSDDGTYRITGTKIFISSGDHDFGGNVVHLVLARLPDAPGGVKGISLFLVPKLLLDAAGHPGEKNEMSVGALEHKMGIHAQPTCVMNYDGAVGWLIGEPNRGLAAMFTMMNAARLFVGTQGLGIGVASYQAARQYASTRLQGRSPDGFRAPAPIIEHPDVRRMLLTARAYNEAGRALAVWTALQMDKAARSADAEERARSRNLVALLTPVVKAALTDFGFESALLAQMVFGGHGYIREWGMEQFVRDARITQIYEGTNGIQALDLIGRKLVLEDGAVVHRFLDTMRADVDLTAVDGGLADLAQTVALKIDRLASLTSHILSVWSKPGWIEAAAADYLRLFSLTVYGWLHLKMAHAATGCADLHPEAGRDKHRLARFFITRILPQTAALEAAVIVGPDTIMEFDSDAV